MKPLLIADLFCGAGGSSSGARLALSELGLRHQLVAVNHWDVAIETHQTNHPDARHFCMNLETALPRMLVPEGRLDLLMASPECVHFSRARGGRPVNDQTRASAWHVVRWCTELRVANVLIENVPEFVDWGPLDRQGAPLKSRRGEYFMAWVKAMRAIGYRVEWQVLNAADYGEATTRERLFVLCRSGRRAIQWPAPSHSRQGHRCLFGSGGQRWRAAREIIDWTIPGRSIFRRDRPLSQKTLARIYAGARRFRWPEPFLVVLRQHMDARPIDEPLPAITAGGTHIGLAEPIIVRSDMHQSNALCVRGSGDPLATITTGGGLALVEPAAPFVVRYNGGDRPRAARSVDDPVSTLDTSNRLALVEPVAPLPIVFQVNQGGDRARNIRSADDPLPTIVTRDSFGVATPLVLPQHGNGVARSIEQPVSTIATAGAVALISPYYGNASCRAVDDPLPTATAVERFGLVMPVTHGGCGDRCRDLDSPLPTVTTAQRGELAFITPGFGERPTQTPRLHDLDEPAPTVCATGRLNLVEGVTEPPEVDILFRMLQPSELAAAMGFDAAGPYTFRGTKTEVIRQIGNAVPVRVAAALVASLLAS